MNTRCLSLLGLALLAVVPAAPAIAAIRRVKADAPGPAHDGQSWATAYTSIQPALNAAQPGDEVWVATGVYRERLTQKNGLALYGGFAGTEAARELRDPKANATVLDAERIGTAVTMAPGPLPTVLDGVTVRNGAQTGAVASGLACANGNAVIAGNTFEANDRAIQISGGTAHIERNTIAGNSMQAVSGYGASVTITGNEIRQNGGGFSTWPILGVVQVYGGGAALTSCTGTVTDNTITGNYLGLMGPLYSVVGGVGLYVSGGDLEIRRNTISGNKGSAYGDDGGSAVGGGLLGENGQFVIADNLVAGNGGDGGGEFGGGGAGAGIFLRNSRADVVNNTIVGNTIDKNVPYGKPDIHGAGLYLVVYDAPTSGYIVANNIIANNTSGVAWAKDTPVVWRHNDVYGNSEYDYAPDLTDPTGTGGNLSIDPLFADAANGDFHLLPGSPAIDTGDSAAVPAGDTDLDGNPRIQGSSVDMGAHEAPSTMAMHVRTDGDNASDGTTWARAKRTIQAALDAVDPDGEVRVAAGMYVGNLTVAKPGVSLLGGFKGRESDASKRDPKANPTVLDGNAAGTVVVIPAEGRSATVDGFTIRNGKAERGSGLNIAADNVRVTHNTIEQCKVSGFYSYGGGVYSTGQSLVVSHSLLRNNDAEASSYAQGGGVCLNGGSGRITNNVFVGDSVSGGNAAEGGAIRCIDAGAEIIGNTITHCGGGVYRPTTFCFGYAVAAFGGNVTFVNNIVAFNTAGVSLANGRVDYNLGYENGYCGFFFDGVFNRYADPLFVDAANGDYRLRPGSPAIDAGNHLLVAPGETDLDGSPRILGPRVDMGAYEAAPVPLTMADVATALRLVGGLEAAGFYPVRLDVTGGTDGTPDGTITLADAIALARAFVGGGQL